MLTQPKIQLSDVYPGISPERRRFLREFFENHPNDSYVLAGPARLGKTAMMEELYKLTDAKKSKRGKNFVKAKHWQEDMTSAACGRFRTPEGNTKDADGNNEYPTISAQRLRQASCQAAVYLDDIDKLRWSDERDFIKVEFLDLLDAVIEGKHQLVVSTNYTSKEEFQRAFGAAIAGRILEVCKFVRFCEVVPACA